MTISNKKMHIIKYKKILMTLTTINTRNLINIIFIFIRLDLVFYLPPFYCTTQVIDDRARSIFSERCVSPTGDKEKHRKPKEIKAVGTALISSRTQNEQLPFDESANDEINRDDDKTVQSSSIELQTYKSLATLLPAEEDRIDETPPATIFKADVNHTTSDHFHLRLGLSSPNEESRDKTDVVGG